MQPEILNIQYHTRRLFVKALNKYGTQVEAAKAIEISKRTASKYMQEFKIEKVNDRFVSRQAIPVTIFAP